MMNPHTLSSHGFHRENHINLKHTQLGTNKTEGASTFRDMAFTMHVEYLVGVVLNILNNPITFDASTYTSKTYTY